MRYCKFGDKPGTGCTNNECPFMHPVLCHHSTNYGVCYNGKCTYQHLSGTLRYSNTQTGNRANSWMPKNNGISVFQDNNFQNAASNGKFQHDIHHEYTRNKQYGNNFSPRQSEFHFKNSDFPPIPGGVTVRDHPTKDEFTSVLKNIQLELQNLKQNQQKYFTPMVFNQENDARPAYQNPESAKNLSSQPVLYNH